MLQAFDALVDASRFARLEEPLRQRREQRVGDQRRLAGTRDPGDHHQAPEGYLGSDVLEVVFACPDDAHPLAVAGPPLDGNRYAPHPIQELTC